MATGKHQSHASQADIQKMIVIAVAAAAALALLVVIAIFLFGGRDNNPPSDTDAPIEPDLTDPPVTEPKETDPPETVPVQISVLSPDGLPAQNLTVEVGESVELTAAVTSGTISETPAWSVGECVTLDVDATGLRAVLTGASAGSAAVTVTADGAMYRFNITVEEPVPPAPEYTNPLTGLACDRDVSEYKPYAVMLNNIKKATPQVGIGQADMIFEIPVEGGITRLMGIYQGFKDAEIIGSIRSARPYFIDIARGFDAIYIHAGGSDDAYASLKSSGITHIDGTNGTSVTFHQDEERKKNMGYEHSLMLDVPTVEPYLTKQNKSLTHKDGFSAGFTFAEPENLTGSPASSVEVKFSNSKSTFFEYDRSSKLYRVSQYDKPMTDGATGAQLTVRNVVTISARISRIVGDTEGRLKAVLTGSGSGWYICDGVIQRITWSRANDSAQFTFTDENGKELVFAPGVTYFAVLPTSSGSVQAS